MLAAGDTFRAAATEQLQIWGERNDISVVAQGHELIVLLLFLMPLKVLVLKELTY